MSAVSHKGMRKKRKEKKGKENPRTFDIQFAQMIVVKAEVAAAVHVDRLLLHEGVIDCANNHTFSKEVESSPYVVSTGDEGTTETIIPFAGKRMKKITFIPVVIQVMARVQEVEALQVYIQAYTARLAAIPCEDLEQGLQTNKANVSLVKSPG